MTDLESGDILEYRCPNTGIMWQWRTISVGPAFVEVELVPTTDNEIYMIPEPMTRALTRYRPTPKTKIKTGKAS